MPLGCFGIGVCAAGTCGREMQSIGVFGVLASAASTGQLVDLAHRSAARPPELKAALNGSGAMSLNGSIS